MAQERERRNSKTLRELLVELKRGASLYCPILIEIEAGSRVMPDVTIDRTITSGRPFDWAEQYSKEYAGNSYLVLEPAGQPGAKDKPVSIGRSRKCDVRIDNDSVSKKHATLVFDSQSGDYFLVDEGSRNGTCINGEPLKPQAKTPVWSGVYLSFGDALYVFIDPPTLRKLSTLAVLSD